MHRGQVMGRGGPATGIKPFTALVDQVMKAEPHASARRVFWVVDDGASHRGWAAAARMSEAWPNVVMVHRPVHVSRSTRSGIYFSIIQLKLLVPDGFADLPALAAKIGGFERRYNSAASSPGSAARDLVTTTSERRELARGWRCGSPGDRSGLP